MSKPTRAAAVMFSVAGEAAPQGSKRAFRTRGGRIALVESSAKLKPWRITVASSAVAAGATVMDCSVEMLVQFTFVRPRSHYTSKGALRTNAPSHPGKPDLDKLVRAVGDALTGICYRDDAQIVRWDASKVYGEQAGATIALYPA
jgi:crossover junction endodeoxyribonuclease RusA